MQTYIESEASKLVKKHFFNKRDLAGNRLSNHCLRVGLIASMWFSQYSEYYKHISDYTEIAILHDILEDSQLTSKDLERTCFDRQIKAIVLLTHFKEKQTYDEYIDNICDSKNIAVIVAKLCDNQDNQCQWRWSATNKETKHARMLIEKYENAEIKLLNALASIREKNR